MRTRFAATIVLAALLVLCLVLPARDSGRAPLLGAVENATAAHLDASLTNTLVAYGVARALNAGISVVQESELDISPAGLGVTLAAGQVLDPLNDIIERFSWLLLVCAASLGVQRVLLTMGLQVGSGVLLPIALALTLAATWAPRVGRISLSRIATTAVAASLIVMFAVPLATLANRWTYNAFLAQTYESSMDVVRASEEEIAPKVLTPSEAQPQAVPQNGPPAATAGNSTTNGVESETDALIMDTPGPMPARPRVQGQAQAEDGRSLLESLRDAFSGADEAMDLRGRIDALRAMLDNAMDSIINLIVVFVLNSVLFPLLFLWALVAMTKRLGRIVTTGMHVEERE
ncbi:hypothetical protein [Oceanidesulfovibrio marinus]|uniref:Uncharacterized protein n=1 Tax=Oceanidesulfovibrio marinus TaxID=370038 RepID=A0ABX6NCM2_9BACT|nr:hypothetical protein [Oceanidesulfovibrio marinus]QJT08332.1 hypothetical protein E8L03_05040 [Oceanidesulfovibrio marinus]